MVLLALAVGCASMKSTEKKEAAAPPPEKQAKQAGQLLEQQRDRAEYEEALTRWRQQNDAQGCREGLERLLTRNPRHCEARLLLAELLLAENDSQAAYAHAKAALDAWPNDARVHFAMAMTLDTLGKPQDALGYYERASKMDPQNESYAAAYQSARKAARGESAGPAVSAAGFTTPSAPDGRADSAVAAVAVDSIDYAGIAASGNPQTAISAAAAAMRAGRPELAVKLLVPAAQRFPESAAVHRALGAAFYMTGDYQSSQVAIQKALSLDKSSALSYLLMGRALAALGQHEAAEANFRQARELDPRYGDGR